VACETAALSQAKGTWTTAEGPSHTACMTAWACEALKPLRAACSDPARPFRSASRGGSP